MRTANADCNQLYEYTYQGAAVSNPIGDPNPRLEAYIAAADRGATHLLLGETLLHLGRPEEAVDHLEQSLSGIHRPLNYHGLSNVGEFDL